MPASIYQKAGHEPGPAGHLLADHSKFGVSSFVSSGRLEDLHTIISDEIPAEFQKHFTKLGINHISG